MAVVGGLISLLLPILVVVLVVLAVRKAGQRGGAGAPPTDAHAVRRFFQYLLLFGLLVVVGVGLAGLLGRLIEGDALVTSDTALARNLAFTVVGIPLLGAVAWWSRRRLAEDPAEARSLGWVFYATLASLTSLVLAMTGLNGVLRWATGLDDYSGSGLAGFLVWGAIWGVHWWIDARVTSRRHSAMHHLAGSLIGLVVTAVGLGTLLADALRVLAGLDDDVLLVVGADPLWQGVVTLLLGVPVWLVYWALTAARQERDLPWLAYVLLAGVGGGLVTAVVAASTGVYSVLVWVLGEPGAEDAAEHFSSAPGAAAATFVGLLVWWYHRAVLTEAGVEVRTEVRRVYEYLMAGIGLGAAGAGVTTLLMALVEALTGTTYVGGEAVNTLLAAATLLAVGGPVWWLHWRLTQRAARETPAAELTSPTRRIYLVLLFGVGGVAAVVALLVGVYLLFQDLVEGTFGEETVRSMRVAIGILLTTAAIAGYHGAVFRADREHLPSSAAAGEAHGPRYVLLIGPPDPQIAREVERLTHGRVQAWSRPGDGLPPWSLDEVRASLASVTGDEVVVLSEPGGLRAFPVHRG